MISVPHKTLSEQEKLYRIHIKKKKKKGFAVGTYKELQELYSNLKN